jgi:Transglycosylase SLT domain
MRFVRPLTALLAFSFALSFMTAGGTLALAQSAEDAQQDAQEAKQRANAATGLVDEAVANREEIERKLADSIARMNELAAQLSVVGSKLDRVAAQVGYADVELAGIKADIEHQAVDAYMTVVASPSVSVVNTETVEEALVASSVVEDVVADGRLTVGELLAKRKSLEELKETFLSDQQEYLDIQAEVDAEVANYSDLYEQADATVASAIREADAAEREYLAALSAVEIAKAKEDERARQENRQRTDTTPTTGSPTTTTPSSGPTTTSGSAPTTAAPATTTPTTSGGGGAPTTHPPQVEQWRGLVSQYFPSSRVDEALAIIDCESNGDPNALNPYSGAAGLFQFLPSTWEGTAPKAGFAGASVFDPESNIGSAAWLGNRYEDLGYDFWRPWNCRRVLG